MSNLQHITEMKSWKRVYFLGIGGIGMSALARLLKSQGIEVSGYDRTPTKLTEELISEGIDVHFDERPDLIPDRLDAVVYTPAVPKNNKEFIALSQQGIPMLKRAELLGLITKNFRLIAVAGTHGKTSISCLIAHIMNQAPDACNAILGGIAKNYQSNVILANKSELFVTEADEFDRSFLHLNPWIAVITATDSDHLDIYGDHDVLMNAFTDFTGNIKKGGKLLTKAGINLKTRVDDTVARFTYSIHEKSDFQAANIRLRNGYYSFNLHTPFGDINDLNLGIPGLMNLENAVAASAAALLAGARMDSIRMGLASFTGVYRRFDRRITRNDFVYIDDYAHHPRELDACIESVRNLYPGKKIAGVFQPHLFTRTRDFADEFARSLEALDHIILLDIYPAREEPIEGVNSQMLLNKINKRDKWLCDPNNLIDQLLKLKPQVLLTLGAGDIDKLPPVIEKAFNKTVK